MNSFIKCGLVFVAGCVVGTLSERNRDKIAPKVGRLREKAADIICNRKPKEKGNGDLHSLTLAHTSAEGVGVGSVEMNKRHAVFLDLYGSLKEKVPYVPFDMKWNNGTGYLNGLVEDVDAIPQGFSISIDALTNRQCVIHRNDANIVVIFQRYQKGAGGVLASNGHIPEVTGTDDLLDKFIEMYGQEFGPL